MDEDRQVARALDQARAQRAAGEHEAARVALVELASRHPHLAIVLYEAACVHDALGFEAQAVPYYLSALALGLPDRQERSAWLGLGSTYRTLGRYDESERTLREGLARFAGAAEMRTFLAMTLYNLGRHHEAMQLLLGVIADTSADRDLRAYERAIRFYAEDLDRRWNDEDQ
jgi:tetratricopeptide (TPR) repeat protein